jgi:hypothetical protein
MWSLCAALTRDQQPSTGTCRPFASPGPRRRRSNSFFTLLPELWPIALFALAAIAIAVWFYRETLD